MVVQQLPHQTAADVVADMTGASLGVCELVLSATTLNIVAGSSIDAANRRIFVRATAAQTTGIAKELGGVRLRLAYVTSGAKVRSVPVSDDFATVDYEWE